VLERTPPPDAAESSSRCSIDVSPLSTLPPCAASHTVRSDSMRCESSERAHSVLVCWAELRACACAAAAAPALPTPEDTRRMLDALRRHRCVSAGSGG
jgi:hypothetical protein